MSEQSGYGENGVVILTPISRGGTNNIENITLSCAKCNLSKGAKTVEEFLEWRNL
jgi:5-methylcytosine-specific restriction endonuclease McrA